MIDAGLAGLPYRSKSIEGVAVLRIIHFIPDSAVDPRQHYLGSTKDVRGRTEYFRERRIDYREVAIPREASELDRALRDVRFADYSLAIIEMTFAPRLLRLLKSASPGIGVITRSHNAEFFHRSDYFRSNRLRWRSIVDLLAILKRTYWDWVFLRGSDVVLPIADWEKTHYWDHLGKGGKSVCVPFFLPAGYMREIEDALTDTAKTHSIVYLTSSVPNSFLADGERNFLHEIARLPPAARARWSFEMTGRPSLERSSHVKYLGMLRSPVCALKYSTAMVALSDLGYGFKTKILEAIVARNFVLVTPGLRRRLPEEVLPFCLEVSVGRKSNFREVLQDLEDMEFPVHDVNRLLKERNFRQMDRIFEAARLGRDKVG